MMGRVLKHFTMYTAGRANGMGPGVSCITVNGLSKEHSRWGIACIVYAGVVFKEILK